MSQQNDRLFWMIDDFVGEVRLVVENQRHIVFTGDVFRGNDREFIPRNIAVRTACGSERMLDSTCINQVTQEHALTLASPRYRSGFCINVLVQRLALIFSDVSDSISEFFLGPKISLATAMCPGTAIAIPPLCFS